MIGDWTGDGICNLGNTPNGSVGWQFDLDNDRRWIWGTTYRDQNWLWGDPAIDTAVAGDWDGRPGHIPREHRRLALYHACRERRSCRRLRHRLWRERHARRRLLGVDAHGRRELAQCNANDACATLARSVVRSGKTASLSTANVSALVNLTIGPANAAPLEFVIHDFDQFTQWHLATSA